MQTPNANEIERAISAQFLTEILQKHSARINGQIAEFQLSPTTLYCAKTGQPIGQIETRVLYETLQVYGADGMADLLFDANIRSVHPAWIKTLSKEYYNEILDKLCENFPQAYAVYCLGEITKPSKEERKNLSTYANWHWSLARAWHYLSFLPSEDIKELANVLCHFCAYMPKPQLEKLIGDRAKHTDILAQLALNKVLIPTLETALAKHFEITVAYEHLLNGPANIRLQQHARQYQLKRDADKAEKLAAEKAAKKLGEFGAAFLDFIAEKPTSSENVRWQGSKRSFAELMNELNDTRMEEIDINEQHFGDAGDDVVEMRRIPKEILLARYEQEKKQEAENFANQPSAQDSIFARRKAQLAQMQAQIQKPIEKPAQSSVPSIFARIRATKEGK